MKSRIKKSIILSALSCLSFSAFGQTELPKVASSLDSANLFTICDRLRADNEILKVDLQKEIELAEQLEIVYKDAISGLEEATSKNIELNAIIDKLREELKKCQPKKRQ